MKSGAYLKSEQKHQILLVPGDLRAGLSQSDLVENLRHSILAEESLHLKNKDDSLK